ncbi:unnamed protein product [Strongylus vulgaris]|uniref:SXP/RAL-2 family protein Ani s 5-like cation-binding domain-containing protein n=1 Tax=Strongylus vulgaris TaxID=40348 RepID=A0A3P7LCY9_STRVU|nr:unnamed protein product [Strongylus vulgaris]
MRSLILISFIISIAEPWWFANDYNEYKNATRAAKEERQQAIAKILEDLPKFFEELEKIETNKDYTCKEERNAVRELCSTLDPRGRSVDYTCKEERNAVRDLCSTLDPRGRSVVNYLMELYIPRTRYSGSSFNDIFFDDFPNAAPGLNGLLVV